MGALPRTLPRCTGQVNRSSGGLVQREERNSTSWDVAWGRVGGALLGSYGTLFPKPVTAYCVGGWLGFFLSPLCACVQLLAHLRKPWG